MVYERSIRVIFLGTIIPGKTVMDLPKTYLGPQFL